MHKLSLYLSDDQIERVKALSGESDMEKIEEVLNNKVYDLIDTAWLKHNADDIKAYLESDDFDDETTIVTVDGTEYDVWSSGDQAVVTFDEYNLLLQRVDGTLHMVLENGVLVECSSEAQEVFEKALKEAETEIKDYRITELKDQTIYKGEKL